MGDIVRCLPDKKYFAWFSSCWYCADLAQNLLGPAPENVEVLQISSISVHFRRSYSRTRNTAKTRRKVNSIFDWSLASSRIKNCSQFIKCCIRQSSNSVTIKTRSSAIAERPARRSVSVEVLCYCYTNNANRSRVSLRSTFTNSGHLIWAQSLGGWGRRLQSNLSMDYYIKEWYSYKLPLEVFTQRNFVALLSTKVEFYWQKQQNRVLCHPLGDLAVTYTVHLWLVGKCVVEFLLVIIEHFSLALTVERILVEIVIVFEMGGSIWAQI